ncbi:lipoyl domain-containing protein [Pseudoduganella namucuonensis]|uniref:Biotin-requiring enzyme n=1 Tax=Pseudoduganella namucuonensis TaxID=1035707 RepID=A0A1I7LX79_9BURK|nr:lipoyl domain-containing protein [Pseudoduganella namucuonensis]SFV14225.1 Biotin-requiring enzyme [Pseudoduganella namucuonensis]
MSEIHLPQDAWQDVEPGTEALLEQWLVKPGDSVKAGQSVAVVVMVKTSIDVLAPEDGVLDQVLIEADATVAQGKPLATLRAA